MLKSFVSHSVHYKQSTEARVLTLPHDKESGMTSDAIGFRFASGSIDRIADDEHSLSLYHEMHRAIPERILPLLRSEIKISMTIRFEVRDMELALGCNCTDIK